MKDFFFRETYEKYDESVKKVSYKEKKLERALVSSLKKIEYFDYSVLSRVIYPERGSITKLLAA